MATLNNKFTANQITEYNLTNLKKLVEQGIKSTDKNHPHFNRVKICCTLGPSSFNVEVIAGMIRAGADIIRINFSHGNTDDHTQIFYKVQQAMQLTGKTVAIMGDIQGPKLRIAGFSNPDNCIELKEGQEFTLDHNNTNGDESRVYLPHKEFFAVCEPNDDIILNDGYIRLVATSVDRQAMKIVTKVKTGGKLGARKGITIPTRILPLSGLSPKDLGDIKNACRLGMDWIALSFVQTKADVIEARDYIAKLHAENPASFCPRVCSKIEKPTAVLDIDDIALLSDMLMVARGDLAIETCLSKVCSIQKYICERARYHGCQAMVATQMVESLIENTVPTRAEVTDVASVCFDGANSVLVTAETAAGHDPVNVVKVLRSILTTTEQSEAFIKQVLTDNYINQRTSKEHKRPDSIALGACLLARELGAKLIIVFSKSGNSTGRVLRQLPHCPVLCITSEQRSYQWLHMCWGCRPVLHPGNIDSMKTLISVADTHALESGQAERGDAVVLVFGTPFSDVNRKGCNNIMAHIVGGGSFNNSADVEYGVTPQLTELTPIVGDN
ncbi:Pyruvate kinase [Giardia duodenalis assemblage B]|uniref:Pyruvate kinase n=3 Tax=Giardia intestinalis TaxID=5741 RepID=A0A132P076_GIAIN|nr:Pyruvate kinase [Giardia intestinalis ATCC 50581]ESU45628.1 Pyruvate kinase [Giardia intestinalis]KWX15739.1 Pyruvate kinase [Giardia intestinalis assemblage B]